MFFREFFRLGNLAGENQLPNFVKMRIRLGIRVIVRTTTPQGSFVDLQALIFCPAEYHGADAPVPDG